MPSRPSLEPDFTARAAPIFKTAQSNGMTVISIFGATGKTGRRVLAACGGRRVLTCARSVRDPGKLTDHLAPPHRDSGGRAGCAAVDETVAGADVVLSLFGQVKGSPPTLQTDGTALIVAAMKRHGVTRIVTLSGGGLPAPGDRPGVPDKVIRLPAEDPLRSCAGGRGGSPDVAGGVRVGVDGGARPAADGETGQRARTGWGGSG